MTQLLFEQHSGHAQYWFEPPLAIETQIDMIEAVHQQTDQYPYSLGPDGDIKYVADDLETAMQRAEIMVAALGELGTKARVVHLPVSELHLTARLVIRLLGPVTEIPPSPLDGYGRMGCEMPDPLELKIYELSGLMHPDPTTRVEIADPS
jgi:hypothetical protein